MFRKVFEIIFIEFQENGSKKPSTGCLFRNPENLQKEESLQSICSWNPWIKTWKSPESSRYRNNDADVKN